LGTPEYWRGFSDGNVLPITIVLPTGRAAESASPHLGLSSDGLLLPEIALAFDKVAHAAGLSGLRLESVFDIDLAQRLRSDKTIGSNLLVIGSAEINVLGKSLLDRSHSTDARQAGFIRPYDVPAIKDSRGRLHMFTTSPRLGLLALYRNPWSGGADRLAILAAGLFAVGSIAANRLLLEYLTGLRVDGNQVDASVPMRLVDGVVAKYPAIDLKPIDDCVPPMDLLNVSGIELVE
jgi:hypothetical protein